MATANINHDVDPWYRQGWPWFIISIPAASVILGFNLLYLAHQTNNSLVVDDYYKAGKGINQLAVRDRLAAALQLNASVTSNERGIVLQLTGPTDNSGYGIEGNPAWSFSYPASLSLRWVHVTQAHKDGAVLLAHLGGGRYISESQRMPQSDQWRLHLEPLSADTAVAAVPSVQSDDSVKWRLVSDRVLLQGSFSTSFGTRQ